MSQRPRSVGSGCLIDHFFHVADHDIAQADPPGLSSLIRAGEEDSVTPIHMFYREWAVIVEIERHPQTAMRLHAAEQSLMSEDAQVRDAAIREAGEIVRAAHQAVAGE